MASAFDKAGDLISLSQIRSTSHLTTVIKNNKAEEHWRMLNDREFPDGALDCNFLLKTYSDISFRTQSEIKKKLYKEYNHKKRLKMLIIIWAVIIPASISILEFFSPTWVAVLAIIYSLWKSYKKWRLMTGRDDKSEKNKAKEKKEQKMRHHDYHCDLNPEGFQKLKMENFNTSIKRNIKTIIRKNLPPKREIP